MKGSLHGTTCSFTTLLFILILGGNIRKREVLFELRVFNGDIILIQLINSLKEGTDVSGTSDVSDTPTLLFLEFSSLIFSSTLCHVSFVRICLNFKTV